MAHPTIYPTALARTPAGLGRECRATHIADRNALKAAIKSGDHQPIQHIATDDYVVDAMGAYNRLDDENGGNSYDAEDAFHDACGQFDRLRDVARDLLGLPPL